MLNNNYAGIIRQALLSKKRGQTGDCFTLSEKMARREKWSEMPPTIPFGASIGVSHVCGCTHT